MTEASEDQKKNSEVTAVTTEYTALQTIYDQMLNLTKLMSKANSLNTTAQGQSDATELTSDLGTKASTLAQKAQNLSDAADALKDDEHLKTQATTLKEAASQPTGSGGLKQKADALVLASSPDNYESKAKPVIQQFDNVKDKFDELVKLAIQNSKLPLVQNVESKFKDLTAHYDGMMPITKIRYYSGEIENESTTLRKGTGGDADNIVKYFGSMKQAYTKLSKDEKQSFQTQFDDLNYFYDTMVNVKKTTKLKKAAGTNPDAGTLRQLAGDLYTRASALDDAVKSVNVADAARVLRHKAGKETEEGKLRKLAANLYETAKALDTAVQGSTAKDDDALKQKAGENENDGLRKLAETLYEAAKALADVVKSGTGYQEAGELADAVGATENNGIRKELRDLASASGALTEKAHAVKKAYHDPSGSNGVKQKFDAVMGQNDKNAYNDGAKKAAYEAVVKAWNAFKDLYETNLKTPATALREAVGSSDAGGKLQKTLQDLGDLPAAQNSQLTNKAGDVKNAYQDDSGRQGVKPKFTELQNKETSYQAIGSIRPL